MNVLDAIASSMSADTARMSAVSQNLVNAGTPAYKREVARAQGFSSLMEASASQAIDMRAGTLRHTGQALDVAIETPNAFFEVQTPEGPAFTRRGDLHVDEQSRLCDHAGNPVMGGSGAMTLPPGPTTIAADGSVRVAGEEVGRLRLVTFTNPDALQRLGSSLFRQTEAAPSESGTALVRQHHLEVSNVDTAAEMVSLMETMRHFESAQKLVQGIDEMHERALRKLGEF